MHELAVRSNKQSGQPWESMVLEPYTEPTGRTGTAFKTHRYGGFALVHQRKKGRYVGMYEVRTRYNLPRLVHTSYESAFLQIQHMVWQYETTKQYIKEIYPKMEHSHEFFWVALYDKKVAAYLKYATGRYY